VHVRAAFWQSFKLWRHGEDVKMATVIKMGKRYVGLVGSKTIATALSSITMHHHTSIIHNPSSRLKLQVKGRLHIQAVHSVVYDHQTANYYSYTTQDMPRSTASQMIIYKYIHNGRKP
jgi:hypothetical protein